MKRKRKSMRSAPKDPAFKRIRNSHKKMTFELQSSLLEIRKNHHGDKHKANLVSTKLVAERVYSFIRKNLVRNDSEINWDMGPMVHLNAYCTNELRLEASSRSARHNPFLLGYRILAISIKKDLLSTTSSEELSNSEKKFIQMHTIPKAETRANLSRILRLFYLCKIGPKGRAKILSKPNLTLLYDFTRSPLKYEKLPDCISQNARKLVKLHPDPCDMKTYVDEQKSLFDNFLTSSFPIMRPR